MSLARFNGPIKHGDPVDPPPLNRQPLPENPAEWLPGPPFTPSQSTAKKASLHRPDSPPGKTSKGDKP